MRFLTVTHFFESHGGGIERVAGQLARNLVALGHECAWAASDADALPADPSLNIVPLRCVNPIERLTGLPMPIPGPRALARLARAVEHADVIIVHDALYCTSIAAMIASAARRVPLILFQHIAAIEFASPVMRRLMDGANLLVTRPMLRAADQVIFISETVHQAFPAEGMKRPAHLLFNGVDRAIFHPGDAERARFGLPERGRVIAFVGRFVEKKGLKILREVATRCPDITFAAAGSGPIDPAQWELSNVRLLGSLAPAEVAALFRTTDALLLPSVGEGYPLVIQEAMACGLPVVCGAESARADPNASRWLHGVEIDLNRADATAERIATLLTEVDLSTEERSAMAAYAATAYDWRHMAGSVAAIARDIAPPIRG